MADFDLSLVVRGTDQGASATGERLAGSLDKVTTSSRAAATASNKLMSEMSATSAEAQKVAGALAAQSSQLQANATLINQVVRATNPLVSSQAALDAAVRKVQTAFVAGKTSADIYARAQQIAARATAENVQWQQRAVASAGSMRAGNIQLGQQIQDIGMQLALGTSAMRVFAMQSGQVGYALSGMGGSLGTVGRIISGPWGSIILTAITLLGVFATRTQEATAAQEDLGDMADYVGRAQSQLGKVIDLVTGKFTNQNVVVREAIRLQAILAQQEAYKTGQQAGQRLAGRVGDISKGVGFGTVTPGGTGIGQPLDSTNQLANIAAFQKLVGDYRANGAASIRQFRLSLETMARDGRLKGLDINATLEDALRIAAARGDYQASKDIENVLDGGRLPDYLRKVAKEKKAPKPKKGPKPVDPFGVEEFGRDAADRIKTLAEGFSDTPTQVEKVNRAVRQLDDLLDDIRHKKPPNMKELLADAEKARGVIQDGINKPFNDFVLEQQKSLDIAKLITSGRVDEANALQIINQLEKQTGPLDEKHKEAVLATVQALRAEQREADILREKQQKYLDLLSSVKDAVKGVFDDPIQGLKDLPGKLVGAVAKLKTEKLFENVFGDAFRQLQDQITGTKTADDAAAKMAIAVDAASAANTRAAAAVTDLASAATGAANALKGVDPLAPQGEPGVPGEPSPYGPDIVVSGRRPTDLSGILQKLAKGVGISDEGAKKLGQISGKAIGGAATGALTEQFLKPLGKAIGFKTSSTGAQIGGALGSFLPIPGGDIIGSIVGSVVGGLFKKKEVVPSGGASLSNVYDKPTGFGDKSIRNASTALAESIQGGLLSIAETLGGSLGSFNVSIGQYDKDWRVNTNGGTGKALRAGTPGTFDFNDDQSAAIRFAIADAVKDGAILGLSDAVKKALGAYEDIDRSLREALKVQQLEDLIGGVGGALTRMFKQFDTEAKERLRLAKTYGLDIIAVEKINGEQRVKLLDGLLKQQLGALQDLQKSLLYGDLFEGDAGTRRSALLAEIAKVTADAEAGVEGATDALASLYRQLIGTSKEAYGTAGPEYAADRDLVTSGLDHIISVERARIEAAAAYQDATLAAATTNNALTNETNDILTVISTNIATIANSGVSGSGATTFGTRRFVSLA